MKSVKLLRSFFIPLVFCVLTEKCFNMDREDIASFPNDCCPGEKKNRAKRSCSLLPCPLHLQLLPALGIQYRERMVSYIRLWGKVFLIPLSASQHRERMHLCGPSVINGRVNTEPETHTKREVGSIQDLCSPEKGPLWNKQIGTARPNNMWSVCVSCQVV